ncbi:DEAD-box ATP-dependent RNA helicase CshA [Rhodopirellula islandica]|uniref:DEAD-box ATP-dependent RNA helicase CshA n=1 Tax=Rhodopirellula islandica TaxID=595434 RepID=A0A0J1B9J1_RHOIS|nr:DEAD-box ATP-dependent RNA helicase CshA [Rhodopirellula islandica]
MNEKRRRGCVGMQGFESRERLIEPTSNQVQGSERVFWFGIPSLPILPRP